MLQGENAPDRGSVAFVALGGNQPGPHGTPVDGQRQVVVQLQQAGVRVAAASHFYQTPAFPAGSGPDFINAVLQVRTDRTAKDLLNLCHQIEQDMGRTRLVRWAPRSIDIDLLSFEAQVHPNPQIWQTWRDLSPEDQHTTAPDGLVLPHPRLQDRSFVLVPLFEIAPDWVHPVLGQTVRQMVQARPQAEQAEIHRLDQGPLPF